MSEIWITASVGAMLASLGRVFVVKTLCRDMDSWSLILYTRAASGVILFVFLLNADYDIRVPYVFWMTTFGTSFLTIAANILYVNALKRGDLSLVVPVQSTIPLFMILSTLLIYGERPSFLSLAFIGLTVLSVGYLMLRAGEDGPRVGKTGRRTPVLESLGAAAVYGVSTVLDRLAIASASPGALAYSTFWNITTAALLFPVVLNRGTTTFQRSGDFLALNLFAGFALLAFFLQQYGVEKSLHIDNGVTYVKTTVMLHIALAPLGGMICLGEPVRPGVLAAGFIAVAGGVGLLATIH